MLTSSMGYWSEDQTFQKNKITGEKKDREDSRGTTGFFNSVMSDRERRLSCGK